MNTVRFGIVGRMRVGKTSVANYLQRRLGFHKAAFSDPIKDFARIVGWDGEKDARGRQLLQDIGTVVRKYDEMYWINRMLSGLPEDRHIVVDDMRMLKEHHALEANGFRTILVVRNSQKISDAPAETTGHVTEREVDLIQPWRVIENNSTFEDLYAQVDSMILEYRELFSGDMDRNLMKVVRPMSESGVDVFAPEFEPLTPHVAAAFQSALS